MVKYHRLPLIVAFVGIFLTFSLSSLSQIAESEPPHNPPPAGQTNRPPPSPNQNPWDRLTPEQRQKMKDWIAQEFGTNSSPDMWRELTIEQRQKIHQKMKELENEGGKGGGMESPKGGPSKEAKQMPLLDERFPKMIEIAAAPEEKVNALAAQIVAARNAPPEKQEEMLGHIMDFRKHLRDEALQSAKRLNIPLTPENEGDYVRAFWTKRVEIEKKLRQEIEPRRKQLMDQSRAELAQQFGGTVPPNPSPEQQPHTPPPANP